METSYINIPPLSFNWNYKTGSCATLLVALSAIGVVAGIFAMLSTYNIVSYANFPFISEGGSIALLSGSCSAFALSIILSFSLLYNRHKKEKKSQEKQSYSVPSAIDTSSSKSSSDNSLPPSPEKPHPVSNAHSFFSAENSCSSKSSPADNFLSRSETSLPEPAGLKPFLEAIKSTLLDKDKGVWGVGHEYHELLLRCGVNSFRFREELTAQGALTPEGIENSEAWGKVRQKLTKLFAQTAKHVANAPRLEWVHGTRSPSLIGIDRAAQRSFSAGKHLLMPTGMLLIHNIAPLTGELCMGIADNGGNQEHLSGVCAARVEGAAKYSENISFCFEPEIEKRAIVSFLNEHSYVSTARLKIAVLRLLLSSETTAEEKKWIKDQLKNILLSPKYSREMGSTWENYAHLLGKSVDTEELEKPRSLLIGDAVGVQRSAGGTTWGVIIDKNESTGNYCVLVENGATKWMPLDACKKPSAAILPPEIIASPEALCLIEQKVNPRKPLEELQAFCDSITPWTLSSDEKKYLETSFPILWGASRIPEDRYFKGVRSDIAGEQVIRGSLALGEEVNSAFTKKKELQRLKEWLEKRSLSVYPMTISAAYFLAAFAHFQQQKAKA